MREKINCLEGECSAYLSPMGWSGIYNICFSQLDGGKDSLSLDGGFSAIIAIRLIRDNYGAVVENYPTSLIGEIWFDLQDMGFSGCPCYRPSERTNWAPVLGRCQGLGRFTELTFFLGLVNGHARLFFKPYQLSPSPWLL